MFAAVVALTIVAVLLPSYKVKANDIDTPGASEVMSVFPVSQDACQVDLDRNLTVGAEGADVKRLQQFLNSDPDTKLMSTVGSSGNETEHFGAATMNAVVRFQEKYSAAILAPVGLSSGSGYVGEYTRKHITSLCAETEGSVSASSIRIGDQTSPAKQEVLINRRNVYSPDPVVVGNKTYLYFGGWTSSSQVHDNIYRATCNADGKSCGSIQVVIDSAKNGFAHLNDPSIVRIAGNKDNGGRDYFIMYMTGVIAGKDGFVPTNNDIYYATSWADDGVNWSKPAKLLEDHWLPSATFNGAGEVVLFANDNGIHGNVVRINLGKGGAAPGTKTRVTYGSSKQADSIYSNVAVQFVPSKKMYYILAERMNDPKGIDAFTSSNGSSWNLITPLVVTPVDDQVRAGTPAFHPNDHQLIYFGSTAQKDYMGHKIRVLRVTKSPFVK